MVQTVADIANKLRRAENRYRINKVAWLACGTIGTTATYYFTDGRRDSIREIAKDLMLIGASTRPAVRRTLWAAFRKSWHATKAAVTAPTQTPGGVL